VAGNLVGAAISNAYYPDAERSVPDTLQRGLTVTVEGAVGTELIEFWSDIAGHYRHKKAEKLAAKRHGKMARVRLTSSHKLPRQPATRIADMFTLTSALSATLSLPHISGSQVH